LLLSLGIVAQRSQTTARAFCVAVSGTGLAAFAQRVGFSVGYKQERLQEILTLSENGNGKTNRDTIPFGPLLIADTRAALRARFGRGRTGKVMGVWSSGHALTGQLLSAIGRGERRVSYRHVNDVIACLKKADVPVGDGLRAVSANRYYYDPVALVEQTGETATMYDIEVEDVHSFVAAGGFVCHNSQGSEYPACVIAVHTQHYMMLARNLIYTALTRAKKIAVFVGSRRAILMAVRNHRSVPRNTRLAQRLQRLVDDLGPNGLPRAAAVPDPSRPKTPPPAIPGRLL
jgi:hypothetical protein